MSTFRFLLMCTFIFIANVSHVATTHTMDKATQAINDKMPSHPSVTAQLSCFYDRYKPWIQATVAIPLATLVGDVAYKAWNHIPMTQFTRGDFASIGTLAACLAGGVYAFQSYRKDTKRLWSTSDETIAEAKEHLEQSYKNMLGEEKLQYAHMEYVVKHLQAINTTRRQSHIDFVEINQYSDWKKNLAYQVSEAMVFGIKRLFIIKNDGKSGLGDQHTVHDLSQADVSVLHAIEAKLQGYKHKNSIVIMFNNKQFSNTFTSIVAAPHREFTFKDACESGPDEQNEKIKHLQWFYNSYINTNNEQKEDFFNGFFDEIVTNIGIDESWRQGLLSPSIAFLESKKCNILSSLQSILTLFKQRARKAKANLTNIKEQEANYRNLFNFCAEKKNAEDFFSNKLPLPQQYEICKKLNPSHKLDDPVIIWSKKYNEVLAEITFGNLIALICAKTKLTLSLSKDKVDDTTKLMTALQNAIKSEDGWSDYSFLLPANLDSFKEQLKDPAPTIDHLIKELSEADAKEGEGSSGS